MYPKFLICPLQNSPLIYALPVSPSYKSQLIQKSKFRFNSFSVKQSEKTAFLGQNLVFPENKSLLCNSSRTHFPSPLIRSGVVKRRKERPFDNLIQRDKKIKLVLRIRNILTTHPDRIMSLRDLGRFRKELGLNKKRRFITLLRKFPAVFEIVEEGAYSLRFKLTPEAECLYLEEISIRNEMEDLLVVKLRKMLMMSLEKRILLEKIAHLRTDFGLPFEFRDTICHRYPEFFKVIATARGPALELTHWDPELAVSKKEREEMETQDLSVNRRMKLPKGLHLSKGEMRRINLFREIPYISPYSDFSGLKSGTLEKEMHACGVVHEILSLTVEKRTLVDNVTHFREEFLFSQQLRGMLIRHPDMFYVSLKGERDSVFLREAYRDSQLVEKNRMLIIKDKIRALVDVPRIRGRNGLRNDQFEDEIEKDMLSDVEKLETDESDDKSDDDWMIDENDGVPTDFNDSEDNSVGDVESVDESNKVMNGVEPVFPDGRTRECW